MAALILGVAVSVQAKGPKEGKRNMKIDHIEAKLDEQLCQVYFFESWATYSHPVTPVRPLFFEQVVQRDNHCRAWMCGEGAKKQFVMFESVANERVPLKEGGGNLAAAETVGVFVATPEGKTVHAGAHLKQGDIIGREQYVATWRDGEPKSAWITQKLNYRYRYHYRPDGSLLKVVITNADGDVTTLDY